MNVDHVTKRYGDQTVVDDLSFTVPPGRVTGFLGPNGSGKSTTMKIMLDLATANRGTSHDRWTAATEISPTRPEPSAQ